MKAIAAPIYGLIWAGSLVLFASLSLASEEQLGDVPIPPGAQLALVSNQAIHNGASATIATYQSSMSLDDTLAFYGRVWPNERDTELPGRLESIVGDWLLISRLRDGINTVVQLSANDISQSNGFISVMAIDSPVGLEPSVQYNSDFRELSRTVTKDGEASSSLSVLQSEQSMSSFIDSLLSKRVDAGWRLTSRKQHAGNEILLMSRTGQQVELVVSKDTQGSVIAVVNEVQYAN